MNKEDAERLLLGLYLQSRDFYYLKDHGATEDDLNIREIMIKKTLETIDGMSRQELKKTNLVQFPKVPWSKMEE